MPQTSGACEDEAIGQAVPHSVFESTDMSPRKAFALWQEQIDHLAEARLVRDSEEFQVRSEAYVIDRLVLGRTTNTTYAYDRSRFRVARSGIDHYMLHFLRQGRLICRKSGKGETAQPGDMIVADMANPERIAIVDLDVVNIVVPRILLSPLLDEPDCGGLRHVSGDNPLVRLLYKHVNALFAESGHLTVGEAGALVPSLLELSAAAINGAVGDATRSGVVSALGQTIRRHVRDHALDRTLSPGQIALQFDISRRKLSYLFHEDGGIASYIQSERLHLARKALIDPAQRGRTIAEIAQAHGFPHRTSFGRAFERAYGLTPGQQRALALSRPGDGRGSAPTVASPTKWIGQF
jgi:AraC-like DNA-binding protein